MLTVPDYHTIFLKNLKRRVDDGMGLKGGIYSSDRCPKCGSKFFDNNKALICKNHPDQQTNNLFVRYPGNVFVRFKDYDAAKIFLSGLQLKDAEGSLDARDYKKAQPLGFTNLANKWLGYKEREGIRCLRNLKNHIYKAKAFFGNGNIKNIGYAELEDFRFSDLMVNEKTGKPLSDKSIANIFTTLHSFWIWVQKREKKAGKTFDISEFPEIKYELNWRKIVDKETQWKILERIKELSWDINPKIYIGCQWLCTYLSIRPIELINVREGNIDLGNGIMYITHNKEGRDNKKVYLLDEDVQFIKNERPEYCHPGYFKQYFFRHGKRKGVAKDKRGRFGKDYLSSWWRRACDDLGIEGVPLYPGTRHSSAVELGEFYSPEEIMGDGTEHATNKAFNRYFKLKSSKKRAIAAKAKPAPILHRDSSQDKNSNLLKLQP